MYINLYIGHRFERELENTKFKSLTIFYVSWMSNPFRHNDFVIEYSIIDDSLVIAERISSGFFIYTEYEKRYPKLDPLTVLSLYHKCKESEEQIMTMRLKEILEYIPNYKEMDWGIYKLEFKE